MYQCVLELEAPFEDHGVCSGVITGSLGALRTAYPGLGTTVSLAVSQQAKRCAHFLSDLVVACAFPPHTSGFALQILELTRLVWQ